MPKIQLLLPILVASFFIFFLLGVNSDKDTLYVEGQVYCDTCRIGFVTRVSEFLSGLLPLNVFSSGAKVRIECYNATTKELTLGVEGATNSTGWYSIPVEGEHEDESCEVKLLSSPRKDCEGPNRGADSSRILITKNVGIASDCRLINPLGFAIRDTLQICGEIVRELDLA